MRLHLANCFQEGKINVFSFYNDKRPHKGVIRCESIRVICYCRQPISEPLATCRECLRLFHNGECVVIPNDRSKDNFVCNYCNQMD